MIRLVKLIERIFDIVTIYFYKFAIAYQHADFYTEKIDKYVKKSVIIKTTNKVSKSCDFRARYRLILGKYLISIINNKR